MPPMIRDRLAGALILSAFLLYGGGASLLATERAAFGLALVLANSLAVLAIGLLLGGAVSPHDRRAATIYIAARTIEAALLAIGAMLVVQAASDLAGVVWYRLGMIALALGSLPILNVLRQAGRIPDWLGWAGIAGYATVVVAMVADSLGQTTAALALLAPGGLFELVFGLWLILKGLGRR